MLPVQPMTFKKALAVSMLMTQDEIKSFLKDGGKKFVPNLQLPLIIVLLEGFQFASVFFLASFVLCSTDILSECCQMYIIFVRLLYTLVSWSHHSHIGNIHNY